MSEIYACTWGEEICDLGGRTSVSRTRSNQSIITNPELWVPFLSPPLRLSHYRLITDTWLDRLPNLKQRSIPPLPLVLLAQHEHLYDHTPWPPVNCTAS